MADTYSPEDVMMLLGVSERELTRLVADGRLRAFREEGETRFLRADVAGADRADRGFFFGFSLTL